MLKKTIGIALIAAAFVVEFLWLGLAFGSIIVGLVLLIFAPGILLAPFSILMGLGLAFFNQTGSARPGSAGRDGRRTTFAMKSMPSIPGSGTPGISTAITPPWAASRVTTWRPSNGLTAA